MKRAALRNPIVVFLLVLVPVFLHVFMFGLPKNSVIAAGNAESVPTYGSLQNSKMKSESSPNSSVAPSGNAGHAGQRRENPLRQPGSTKSDPISLVSQTSTPNQAASVPHTSNAGTTGLKQPVANQVVSQVVDHGDNQGGENWNIGFEDNGLAGIDPYTSSSATSPVLSSTNNSLNTDNRASVEYSMEIPDADSESFGFGFENTFPNPHDSVAATTPTAPSPLPSSNSALVTPQNADPLAPPSIEDDFSVPFANTNAVNSEPKKLAATSPRSRSTSSSNNSKVAQQLPPNTQDSPNQNIQTTPSAVVRQIEGNGIPGPAVLEGPQIPQLTLEKIYPQEIQVNRPCTFKTYLRNSGKTPVKEIVLHDLLPQGTRFISAHPPVNPTQSGELLWTLGTLQPDSELIVELEVLPLNEGEIGSVATVQYAMEASGKTVVTRPLLDLEISEAPDTLVGENVTFNLTLSNPGTGIAKGVELELRVPDGLVHEKGQDIIFTVGELKPKEVKRYPLTLKTVARGKITDQIRAKAESNLESVANYAVQVIGPELVLQIDGPKQRFLERKAVYTLKVGNPGTASAQNIALSAYLPSGLQFVSTNQNGVYDQSTHTVHWALEELPARESGEIELMTLPVRQGEHSIKFEGIGQKELRAETTHAVSISGLPALSFAVSCLSDPVEVGKPATYEIALTNRGTKAASNVVISVRLPEGMEFANAEGPSNHRLSGNLIQFAPLNSLDPKQEKTYRFTARCTIPGDQRVAVSVLSDDLRSPITKEESTQVFGDQ
ncbi:MAG: hypothetical protein ACRC10_08930 [Thermoguttaceae bacterium]